MNLLGSRPSPAETTDPDPDFPDQPLAPMPAFRTPRPALPGAMNPDPLPDGGQDQADDARPASDGQTASIPAFFKQRAKSYAKIAGTLLTAAGGLLNARAGDDSDAFLPDEEDLETIPPPIGRLMARRIKIGADPEQLTDVEDLGIAAVGIIMWLAKGASAMWDARRERRRAEQGRSVHTDAGDGQ